MSKITYYIKKKIGKDIHSFSVEGENLHDVVMTSRNLSFSDVEKCGKCGSDFLDLGAHVAKNRFKYVTIKCKACKAYVNFGQQQENPDVFYLRIKDEGGKKVLDWRDKDAPMEESGF